MDLDIKTRKPPQFSWRSKIFSRSSLKWKHSCSSTTLDDVNDECCPIVNPANPANNGICRLCTWKSRRRHEDENDKLAVENEVQTNSSKELINSFLLNLNDKWDSKMKSISKQLMSDGLHLIRPQESGTRITGLDNDGQEIMDAVKKPYVPKILLYLILQISSSILCLLPRIYGDKIPNLFLPNPWLFYGSNFALMLAAAASLVTIDTMSNNPKVTRSRSFSNLAVISIFASFSLFLISFELRARSLSGL